MATTATNGAGASVARRTELAAFLRTRRERITPADVGLAPGRRRRTSGLRREEVAQLAGVGVTWYTWLEQGRPINASTQVLDAIARTLRLDPVERAHLFRLADVPGADLASDCADCPVPEEVQHVLDALSAVPASIVSERFDLLAWNDLYAVLFPGFVAAPPAERNTLLAMLTAPACCTPSGNPDLVCEAMIGQLRVAYGRHVGDPAWAHFIRRMEAASPAFAQAWAAHGVAQPSRWEKSIRHPGVGAINVATASFAVDAMPGARMVAYTPSDAASGAALARLAAGEERDAHFPCWPAHAPGNRGASPALAGG